jgi:uncharacterized protein (DUF433 family)
MKLTRITIDPRVCTGKPCIRGLRFPVAQLLGLLAAAGTRDQILGDYPYLEPKDIDEALQYAALLAEDETVELGRVKFLVDVPAPPALAHWPAAQGHDAVHASAVGLDRSTDTEILTRKAGCANGGYRRSGLSTVAGRDWSGRTKPDLVAWG